MQVISRNDVAPSVEGVQDGNSFRITKYIGEHRVADTSGDVSPDPVGFIVDISPTAKAEGHRFTVVAPHFHLVRQFQVFVDGDQLLIGKRDAQPFDFHYADPSTPYGPFTSGSEGISFFTLRPRRSVGGIYWMPGSRDKMTARAGRNLFVSLADHETAGRSNCEALLEPSPDGLAAFRVTLAPGESALGPDPAQGDGQYYVVMDGELLQEGTTCPALSLLWADPTDGRIELTATAAGASVLVLQFPVLPGVPAT